MNSAMEKAKQRIAGEVAKLLEELYDLLEEYYPAPKDFNPRDSLDWPINLCNEGGVIAMGDIIEDVSVEDSPRLLARLSERFEAELRDFARLPHDPASNARHWVTVYSLYLARVLIPLAKKSDNKSRAVDLVELYTATMFDRRLSRVDLAGGDGFGDSTLAVLIFPFAELAKWNFRS
jgi:hypothetical protein